MFHVPNQFRVRTGVLASKDSDGNYGAFTFILGTFDFFVIASEGLGWEHVSVTPHAKRTPTWEQMCQIKDMFWDPEDCVVQYHPPLSQYVNEHKHCLHLWRKIGYEFPLPGIELVGKPNKVYGED